METCFVDEVGRKRKVYINAKIKAIATTKLWQIYESTQQNLLKTLY
jgi:hypothetical protein